MRKSLLAVTALALAPMMPAQADNEAGCGLGTQIMEGKDGIVFHVLAATTNGTFGNQTFGMTSGTLGCDASGKVTASADLRDFASANLDQLSVEMATGEGEALTALATLYGIEAADRDAFYGLAKSNYTTIISSDEVTAGEVLASIHSLMAADARLARYAA
jgi:Protein of unknown function (DUF3015)